MWLFRLAVLLVVVVGLIPGCSGWLAVFGNPLNRYPVEVIKTREDAGLRGAVTQVITWRLQEQASENQEADLLDVAVETYSRDGLRISRWVKGPVTDRHEMLEMKREKPVRRIVRENGKLTLCQILRYDARGNIIKLDSPAGGDDEAACLATGGYLWSGNQVREPGTCFDVVYFENKQLLRRCGEDFLRVAVLDDEGRVLKYMTFPQGVDLIANTRLNRSSQAIEFSYDLQGRMKNRARYVEGSLMQAHRYTYGKQGELVLEERESFGAHPMAENVVYKDYRSDEQENWVERIVEYYQIKDNRRLLTRSERTKRTIIYGTSD